MFNTLEMNYYETNYILNTVYIFKLFNSMENLRRDIPLLSTLYAFNAKINKLTFVIIILMKHDIQNKFSTR